MQTDATATNSEPGESGTLKLQASAVSYESQRYGSFRILLSDVALIGEWTNQDGPILDDWFLVFVQRDSKQWCEASMYALGATEALQQIASALGQPIGTALANSTDFASRILWPPSAVGSPLFSFHKVAGRGILRQLRETILPEVSHELSQEALSALDGRA